jgi:molybdate transport system ATP-binding protein
MKNNLFLELKNVSVRLNAQLILKDISLKIKKDESWLILGKNGAGKSTLLRTFWGGVDLCQGQIFLNFVKDNKNIPILHKAKIGYVSFELKKNIFKKENFNQLKRDYQAKFNKFTSVYEVILAVLNDDKKARFKIKALVKIANDLGIKKILKSDIQTISEGEFKKMLIARALIKKPKLLILDEPFDGLDKRSRNDFKDFLNNLIKKSKNSKIILAVHRKGEILKNITHVAILEKGQIKFKGYRDQILNSKKFQKFYFKNFKPDFKLKIKFFKEYKKENLDFKTKELIKIKNATVKYGKKFIFKNFNFKMQAGENWMIYGPNGAGKTTFLRLILGENLQSYANQIWILGKKRGTGETIWEVKKNIGYVSDSLQINYSKAITVKEVILSGFFDSIGLYQKIDTKKAKIVDELISFLEIKDLENKSFNQLSNGQKRIVLIARALVKKPKLLILDEPLSGLDIENRNKIKQLLDFIAKNLYTNLILVTHYKKDRLKCINRELKINPLLKPTLSLPSSGRGR